MEKISFGAGCFWSIEHSFKKINGVISTQVGYAGGHMENPSYEDVCTGKTGHTEVVELEFDPQIVSFAELLIAFWQMHDPTTLDKQGPDVGPQYRSVIFYHTPEQEGIARKAKEELNQSQQFGAPVVTAIEKNKNFFKAEEYHQRYIEKKS